MNDDQRKAGKRSFLGFRVFSDQIIWSCGRVYVVCYDPRNRENWDFGVVINSDFWQLGIGPMMVVIAVGKEG